jgi:CheY-like chemotaxis protein
MQKTSRQDRSSPCLLLVDDNRVFRKTLLKFLMNEFESYRITEASDGIEAMEVVKEYLPDLVILDLNLPGISGFEVARYVKKEFPLIPIIVLSNYDENVYREEAKKTMVDAYIIKKNLVLELPDVIKELMSVSQTM